MQALTMIVFQRDPRLAQSLASTLSHHYHTVHLADSVEELRVDIARYRAEVAVLDVEAELASAQAAEARDRFVVRIDDAIGECQKRGEDRVRDVGDEQTRQQQPERLQ